MTEITSCPPGRIMRKMGFIRDQKGILNRYLREGDHWEEHLRQSRECILNAVEREGYEMLGILGSGWLIDVPLEELSARCEGVFLVDLYHPPQVVHRVRRFSNVKLVCADITGGWILHTWETFKRRKWGKGNVELLPEPLPEFSFRENSGGWISVNLLDQLDDLVCGFMGKSGLFSGEEMDTAARVIQKSHIDFLKKHRGLLIADTLEYRLKKGEVVETGKPLKTDLPEGDVHGQWKWIFDTGGWYHPGMETWFEVSAVQF